MNREQSAINSFAQASKRVDELARIDASSRTRRSQLKQAEIGIEESAWTLRDYLDKLEATRGGWRILRAGWMRWTV